MGKSGCGPSFWLKLLRGHGFLCQFRLTLHLLQGQRGSTVWDEAEGLDLEAERIPWLVSVLTIARLSPTQAEVWLILGRKIPGGHQLLA